MELNLIGLTSGLAVFSGIWFGHAVVRKIDSVSPSVKIPAVMFLIIGLSMEAAALFSGNLYATAILGILGMTFLWDSLEFYRQHKRVQIGHAPANPRNPRHAEILANSDSATRIDWLMREPTGCKVRSEELRRLEEGNP